MTSEPRYSRPALQDFLDIAKYISRDNPVAAASMVDRLEAACRRVFEHPNLGVQHEELPETLLVHPVGKYLIVYQTDDEGVLIVRVIHGARDLSRLFPESP